MAASHLERPSAELHGPLSRRHFASSSSADGNRNGASLPQSFFEVLENDLPAADLVLVAGTSLVVSPANLIALAAPDSAPPMAKNAINRWQDNIGQVRRHFLNAYVDNGCWELLGTLLTANADEKRYPASAAHTS